MKRYKLLIVPSEYFIMISVFFHKTWTVVSVGEIWTPGLGLLEITGLPE